MKKKIGRFLKIFAFCALLAVAVAGVSRLVERKESREKMQPFLSRAGEYDVLFLGDSIMNTGVFPMEIWEKYGIAGYNIASYGNTLPITYWALQNALDYAEAGRAGCAGREQELQGFRQQQRRAHGV